MLTSDKSFTVVNSYGRTLPMWDEAFGELWLYVESLGIVGVIRAQSWEEAYECAVDELMSDADPEDPDTYARSYDPSADPEDLAEGCHYRSSGEPSNPALSSHIACEDLNGSMVFAVNSPEGRRIWRDAGLKLHTSDD